VDGVGSDVGLREVESAPVQGAIDAAGSKAGLVSDTGKLGCYEIASAELDAENTLAAQPRAQLGRVERSLTSRSSVNPAATLHWLKLGQSTFDPSPCFTLNTNQKRAQPAFLVRPLHRFGKRIGEQRIKTGRHHRKAA